MGTGLKFLFEEEVTMNQGTNLGSQIGRWIILAAVVALLGALLLTIRPVGAQSADGPPQLTIVPPNTVEHNENDDGPVYTFVATDPERRTIFWTLSGTDADDFMIAGGVLKFKNAPDYEIPRDDTRENTPVATSDGTYEVTVRFSDGGNAAEHDMKVEVQDVGEAGEIMFSPLQPQVGTPLQAVIIDLDGVSTNTAGVPQADYQWAKSDTMTGTYTDISGATGATYTPTADDVGSYLQVTVTYLEHASTRPAKTEVGTATLPVRADTHMNVAPAVPLTGQGQGRTGALTGNNVAIIRYVAEDAAVGAKVGPPVTAVDDNRDLLTYAFGGTEAQMDAAEPFDIDPEFGQITTNRALDFAEDTAANDFDAREVVVTATDPDGEVLSIRVDIRVTDVDEPPEPLFANEPTREVIIMENSTGVDRHVGTYTAATFAEDPDDPNTAVTLTIDGADADAFEFEGVVVQFIGDDNQSVGDAGYFDIDYENPGDVDGDNLYELLVVATDSAGMQSSLAVTVKVTNDPTDDDNNTPGTLEIFNRQPEVNTLLSVEDDNPMDSDGNERSVKWQWYWQTIGAATVETPATCPAFDPAFDPTDPQTAGDPDLNSESPWMKIVGATSSSYMPTLDRVDDYDTDVPPPDDRETAQDAFDCLMVRASYLDGGPRSANDSSTVDYDESREYAYAVSEFSVQNEDTENVAPEFRDGDTALAGIQVRPRIQENFPGDPALSTGTAIFEAVALATENLPSSTPGDFLDATPDEGVIRILDGTFTDDDEDGIIEAADGTYTGDDFTSPTDHKLTFAISGPDVGDFELVDKATGAINFTATPDYEVLAQRRYTVTLIAHDPTNATDSITVIVDVENVNEDPEFIDNPATLTHNENSTDTVGTYTADDQESDRYFWGLTGTDAALFDISIIDGRLTFRNAPNFEDPDDDGTDNVYNVVVHLLMDGETVTDEDTNPTDPDRTQAVAITVVDVAEAPFFTKTTDDDDNIVHSELNIAENKHPDTMLNRAVEFSPQASDEDEIPEDDMYASVALVYTISGTGTEALSIVPATGELRTKRVLDYESGDRSFEVKVTATDPTGLDDSIDLMINVTDEDEAPVGGGTNQAPVFASSTMTREVAENTATEINFGDPITATDPQDQEITYTLGGADAGHFDIDSATGQLKTSGALDHESTPSYTVTVTAMDDDATAPMSDETTVTITVTNVIEVGTVEGDDEPTYAEDRTDAVETYTLSGGTMDDMAEWTVSGDDADAFTIPGGVLEFNSQPDFEDPMGGADNDSNTYMVTVMAEAGGEMKMMEVTITVENVDEDGAIILDTESPVVDGEVTATLSDLDGSISNVTWTWQISSDDATWSTAAGAATDAGTTSTYTPVEADAGRYLRATASYTDGYGADSVESESAMVVAASVNVAPEFPSASTTRTIAENTAANANIGSPVEATDPNGDTLTYTLGGTNAASFGIVGSTGQLRTSAALDFETKSTYSVEVTATDLSGLSDTIDVTINVTDVVEVVPEVPAIVQGYDTNGTPGIQISELFDAIDDYFDEEISISQLFEVIDAYFG